MSSEWWFDEFERRIADRYAGYAFAFDVQMDIEEITRHADDVFDNG